MSVRMFIPIVAIMLLSVGCTAEDEQSNPAVSSAPQRLSEKDIVQQVNDSGHARFFSEMVALGPEGTQQAHYSSNCIGCHSAIKILDDPNAQLEDFFTGGKYQAKLEGISCRVCHAWGGPEGIKLRKAGWAVCGDCHTSGGGPVLGKEVHHPQYDMIKGLGVGEVADKPSYKYENMVDFTCYDCHQADANKHTFLVPGVTTIHDGIARVGTKIDYQEYETMFKQQRCKDCHAITKDMVDDLKKKQETVGGKLDQLRPIYEEWSKQVAKLDPADPRVKAFQEGATYFTYVEADGSKGTHNFELAKELLAKAEAKFAQLK